MNAMNKNIDGQIYPVKYTTESCNEQCSYFTGWSFNKLSLFAN